MNKSFYSYDGEIRIYIRKNTNSSSIQLIHKNEKKVVEERKAPTKDNIKYYQREGLKAWIKLNTPKEIREVKTLNDFYLTAFQSINMGANADTAKDRIRRFEKHVLPYLGNIKLDKIKALRVEEWQTKVIKIQGTDQVRRCKYLLKAVLDRAIVYELIDKNVVTATTKIRTKRTDKREVYTKEEIKTMLEHSTGQLHLFILTMVSLGLRSGEIVVIKYSDIDFKESTIRIERSIRNRKISTPKTGVSRDVEIPTNLLNKLKKAYSNYKIEQERYNNSSNQEGYIFVNQNNTYYKDCSYIIRRHFKPFLERLGLKYKSLYSLRHTYATLSIQGGQTVNYISKQLGHADTRVTLEYYTKYLKDEESIKRADKILSFE